MSGTEDGNAAYSKIIPDSFVYSDYHPDVIDNVMERQKQMQLRKVANSGMFIVLDDLGFDAKILKEKSMRYLFMNGRHLNIFLCMTFQYVKDMPPAIRSNIDYVFINKDNSKENIEKLYSCFGGFFPNIDTFRHVMDNCTENYECMVIDNTSNSKHIEDNVFWYKAHFPTPKFRMGSPEFWALHNKKYNKDYGMKRKTVVSKTKSQFKVKKLR